MIPKHICAFVRLSNIVCTNQDWSPQTRLLWINSYIIFSKDVSEDIRKFFFCIYYNLLIYIREINKRTNLGKMYFENTYIIIISNMKAKVTWFMK
jgi:hypothetical protein